MAKTGFTELFEQLGAGQDYIAKDGNDSVLRFKMIGDTFPRVIIAVKAGDLLVGNGASPPVSVIGSPGGPGVNNGLPVYNVVAQYNADPTGVADAASPINQAISDAAATGGGWVFVPVGTYSIASADVVMLSGVTLISESADGVTFVDNRATGSTIRLRGVSAGAPIERAHVQGITITGSNPGTNTRKAIEVKWAQRCVVTGNDINNSAYGTWIYGAVACAVTRNRYKNCSSRDGTNRAAVHVIDDASGHSDSVHITDNSFEDCYERDIVIFGAGANRPEEIIVAGNRFAVGKLRGRRIQINVTIGVRVHDNLFAITAFDAGYSTRSAIITIVDGLGTIVHGNTISLEGAAMVTAAILVDATIAGSSGVTIAGNKFYVNASCAPSVALIQWAHTLPHYNLIGTDRDNVMVTNGGNADLRSGLPDTFSETMTHGPLYAKECGVIADGIAYDGAALAAFFARCNSEGRHGILPDATMLCATDATHATLLTIDRYGTAGDVVIEGGAGTVIDFVADLGVDAEGRPNIGFNPINCEQGASVCLYNVAFVGNQDQSAAALNPNASAVALAKGAGVRIPNRCDYRGVTANGFKYGFIQDGTAVQDYAATVQTNNATITVTRPLDRSWTGVDVTGAHIPAGATIITIASDGLSFTVNNAHKPTGNDASVRISVPQNTDHFETDHVNADANGIGLYLDRMDGADSGGTLDFVYRNWTIGRCQWAGIACSDTGALHDALLDKVHVANIAYSFIKEGLPGVTPSLNTMWENVSCVHVKSEGAGNAPFYDFSGLAGFVGVSGVIELHGVEINGQKTHKAVVNNHTYQPWSGNAARTAGTMTVTGVTAGILERPFTATLTHGSATVTAVSPSPAGAIGLPISGGCIKPGTVIANLVGTTITLSQAAGTAGAQGAGVDIVIGRGIGPCDHVAVNSDADPTYVDCALVLGVVSATSFTAKMGAQSKVVTTSGWTAGDTTTTVTSTVNVKNQDIGCIITGSGGHLDAATLVDDVDFKTQTLTFSIPAVSDAANGQTLTLALVNDAGPTAITFGEIVGLRLGAVSDIEQLRINVQLDPTTENIATSMWWSFYSLQDVDIALTPLEAGAPATDFPNLEVLAGINGHMNTQFRKGRSVCVPREANGTFFQGDRLVASGSAKVKLPVVGVADPHEGYCRGCDGQTFPGIGAGLTIRRPVVLVQRTGPNYRTAFRWEGGGIACATPSSIASGKWLVADDATGIGTVNEWNGFSNGLLIVAKSTGTGDQQAAGVVDVELTEPFWTG